MLLSPYFITAPRGALLDVFFLIAHPHENFTPQMHQAGLQSVFSAPGTSFCLLVRVLPSLTESAWDRELPKFLHQEDDA